MERSIFKSGIKVEELQQAKSLLEPLLGNSAAVVFALALLMAGISSTITSGNVQIAASISMLFCTHGQYFQKAAVQTFLFHDNSDINNIIFNTVTTPAIA